MPAKPAETKVNVAPANGAEIAAPAALESGQTITSKERLAALLRLPDAKIGIDAQHADGAKGVPIHCTRAAAKRAIKAATSVRATVVFAKDATEITITELNA